MNNYSIWDSSVRRVRKIIRPWVSRRHDHDEDHPDEGVALREVVFGANDGLVSNVALVAGIAGGTSDAEIIILGGIAGLVAGAISMGLGAYVSTKSESDFRSSEESRERWEIENLREKEIDETKKIFAEKGIEEPLLSQVVDAVTKDHERWIKIMMTEELGFPDHPPRPIFSALIIGFAFALAAFFPVMPYLFMSGQNALIASFAFTGIALFGIGSWRAALSRGNALINGLEMIFLAGVGVAIAFLIGRLVGIAI